MFLQILAKIKETRGAHDVLQVLSALCLRASFLQLFP